MSWAVRRLSALSVPFYFCETSTKKLIRTD